MLNSHFFLLIFFIYLCHTIHGEVYSKDLDHILQNAFEGAFASAQCQRIFFGQNSFANPDQVPTIAFDQIPEERLPDKM